MTSRRRDLAARYLELVTALLPRSRRDWGDAMRAELTSIADRGDRRRFALGCTRVAAVPGTGVRGAGTVACIGALVALSGVIGLAIPVTLIFALLVGLARRPGYLGPARPSTAARCVRAAGCAFVAGLVATQVLDGGVAGLLRPMHGGALSTLAMTALVAAFLAATGRATGIGDTALATGASAGLVAGVAGFAVMSFERIGTPLADGLPSHGSWLIAVVFAAPAAAALITAGRTRSSDQSVMAVACAGTFAALTVALLGFGAIALFPHAVPDIAGPAMLPGASAAARQAENAREAADPYWGYLVFGSLLALLLWAVARPPGKADLKLLLLACLAAPAVALAFAGDAGTIALATAGVALVAAARTRREAAPAT